MPPKKIRKKASATSESPSSEDLTKTFATQQITVSDSSPDSSDTDFGAKTLMRKVKHFISDTSPAVSDFDHEINDADAEEVPLEEVRANPKKYFVANFRGDHLSYFNDNPSRRSYVKNTVDGTINHNPPSYKSQAVAAISKEFSEASPEYKSAIQELGTAKKLADPSILNSYKSPAGMKGAVKKLSNYGNSFISTSKDTEVTLDYADHGKASKTGAAIKKPHPQYDYDTTQPKKPKHRLIGTTTVVVHEANEYLDKPKADIETLAKSGLLSGKSSQERLANWEIIFGDEIPSNNIAGYVPLAYPNLTKSYSDSDQELFGLSNFTGKPTITRSAPKTLGGDTKEKSIYKANRELQWKLAMKHVKTLNPDGELLWVDDKGKFRKFRQQQLDQTPAAKASKPNSNRNDDSLSSSDSSSEFASSESERDGSASPNPKSPTKSSQNQDQDVLPYPKLEAKKILNAAPKKEPKVDPASSPKQPKLAKNPEKNLGNSKQ